MATAPAAPALMSLEEYLHTTFKPDCDFVDGVIEERNVGEYPHNKLQFRLLMWFGAHESLWGIDVVPEQRIQVVPERVRVCDVCLLGAETPVENITLTPPILCVDILSPEDRIARAELVLEDYRAMGVRQSWLLDPLRRVAYTFDERGLQVVQSDRLELPGAPIHVILSTLFASLDKIR